MRWIEVIFVFSAIIIIHELGHFLAARKVGVRVDRFSIGFGPALLKFKKRNTEFVISAIPLGGYVKLAGEDLSENLTGAKDEFYSKSILQRFAVIFSGPFFNLVSAFIVISLLFMSGQTSVPSESNAIGQTVAGYPAEKAGIKKGDVVVSINGEKIKTWSEITSIIHKSEGKPVALEIARDKKIFSVLLKPKTENHKDIFGRDIKMSFVGISPEIINRKYNPAMAFYEGFKTTVFWTGKIYQGLWLIMTKQVSLKNVAGPIGIFAMTEKAAESGITALLSLVALISINLAVVNLLPFPILDGGHIMFLVIEKIRRRPLSAKTQENITQAALYVLVALFILISYNDLARHGIIKKITSGLWK
ncbi:MAG: RIP metalloprotease RseP [Candidatus Omnitrophica bacterium]|nr:RIP metalloprotease RseP [Candidatus Omnitrophota bacterium]